VSLPRDRATVSEAEWELAIRRSRVMDELLVRGSGASVPDPFRVPNGFNTPVQVANWLSFAPLAVHRPLLAVFAGLLQPESPLWPADFGSFGRGRFLLI
jgi:hypothetical protein